jgi:hypothetical protein
MFDGLKDANAGYSFPRLWFGSMYTVGRVTPSAMAAVRKKMRAERTLPKRPKPLPALHQNLVISGSNRPSGTNANEMETTKFQARGTEP